MPEATDADLRRVARDAGLELEVVGHGPPVLCIHSSGLSGRQWRSLADGLASRHRVLMPDLMGYGGARQPAGPSASHNEDDLASLRPLLEALGAPVAMVGHSYGGYLALRLAAERSAVDPDGVWSVALYEPVAFGVLAASAPLGLDEDPAVVDLAEIGDPFFDLGDGGYEGWLRRFVDWWNGPGAWDGIQSVVQDAFRASQEKMYAEVRALTREQPTMETYAGIRASSLFLHGDATRTAAKAVCRRCASVLPQAKAGAVVGAGHMGPLTHRDEVNARIAGHLDGVGQTGKTS